MIVYSETKQQFRQDVLSNQIEVIVLNLFKNKFQKSVAANEIAAWKNSMRYMDTVLEDSAIPNDARVSIEYSIPNSSKRIDFILTGKDANQRDTAIVIELKQWTEAQTTSKDAIVKTRLGRGEVETEHPSYQAWTYVALLQDFSETVQTDNISLYPCAYLHNCLSDKALNDPFYSEHVAKAPLFLKNDAARLREFIKQYVKYGDSDRIMYRIDCGRIRPSKALADSLASMLSGNREFLMIDDQKLVYETALQLADESTPANKQVLIVEGGPGTGKSVVAINLLVELTGKDRLVQYVSRNAAPRDVYASKLTGTLKKTHINNLFKGSGGYTETEPNTFDALIVDEAHRLNEKSGMYQNLGENQIMEIIRSSKFSVFFLDEDQRVTFKDIGEKEEIIKWAKQCGATVTRLALQSQFRCNGSNGYLAWLDNTLQVRETANQTLDDIDYEFVVFDSPNDLRNKINDKNLINNRARIVAGYCWDWASKKRDPNALDVSIPEYNFAMRWNLLNDGNLWILKPEAVKEIGCIHTCQGLELDYIGVIIGPDLIVRNGKIITDAAKRSSNDRSIIGYKSQLKTNPEAARKKADLIIKNTYRTLMTRGQRGCYIFCVDPETNAYFKSAIRDWTQRPIQQEEKYPNLPLTLLKPEEVRPYQNAVPIFDIKIAAGQFSEEQILDRDMNEWDWVQLEDPFTPREGLFVARVIGESMNKRIPNGSWCLFKVNPGGTRQGKIVLVQHRDIHDHELGGQFTVKTYYSEKTATRDNEQWSHTRIVLKPETNAAGYEEIVFTGEDVAELRVVGELVAVLG